MADVSVRPARPADAERIAHLQLLTWREAYPFLPAQALDVPLDQAAALWLRAIEVPPTAQHRVLVAMERDEVVGLAASGPAEDDDLEADSTAELSTLVVEPRWGRRGHGARLVAATVDHWRGDGTATAVHWAWAVDAATRTFLASAGWDRDGYVRELDLGDRTERQIRFHTDLTELAGLPGTQQ